MFAVSARSQNDSVPPPPYLRFPTVPPFKLLEVDSSSYFAKKDLKKNEPVLIMLFNPDCDHCKHETEEIIKNIDHLKNVQIVMATMMPFDMMKSFYEKYFTVIFTVHIFFYGLRTKRKKRKAEFRYCRFQQKI